MRESGQDWMDNQQFADEIAKLCAAGRTGTVFCTTRDGGSASLGLQDGAIISLTYKNQRGIEALSGFKTITRSQVRFLPNVILQVKQDLPASPEILSHFIKPAEAEQARPALSPELAELLEFVQAQALELFAASEVDIPLLCQEKLAAINPESLDDIRRALKVIAAEAGEADLSAEFVARVFIEAGLDQRSHSKQHEHLAALAIPISRKRLHGLIVQEIEALFGAEAVQRCNEAIAHASWRNTPERLREHLKSIGKELGGTELANIFIARVMSKAGIDARRNRLLRADAEAGPTMRAANCGQPQEARPGISNRQ